MIDIRGLRKAAVLAALYNASHPQGLGRWQADGAEMSEAEAEGMIAASGADLYFDYVKGRVVKVDLRGEAFSPAAYDRDNGVGAAQRVIARLRAERL